MEYYCNFKLNRIHDSPTSALDCYLSLENKIAAGVIIYSLLDSFLENSLRCKQLSYFLVSVHENPRLHLNDNIQNYNIRLTLILSEFIDFEKLKCHFLSSQESWLVYEFLPDWVIKINKDDSRQIVERYQELCSEHANEDSFVLISRELEELNRKRLENLREQELERLNSSNFYSNLWEYAFFSLRNLKNKILKKN